MSRTIVTTPFGEAEWFSLSNVDKFGNYTCNLKLDDSPETHKLISKIDSLGGGSKPYKKEADGSFTLKLKVKSMGQKKDGTSYTVNPPVVYDSLGKKIEGQQLAQLNVGNGSKIRAKVELSHYSFMGKEGVSCKPKSVQIAELVEFQAGGDFGFDSLELEEDAVDEESGDSYDF